MNIAPSQPATTADMGSGANAARSWISAPLLEVAGFNPLAHPIAFQEPQRLSDFSVWRGHLPFAMTLIDLLRPRTLVELGTHWGDSYCAFCQAVHVLNINTRCVAVDTWSGDEHAGFYESTVLSALKAYHDPHYGDFSRLRQGTFDEALGDFADGSLDVLHIDGLHTYEAVRHDFESYLPKLSEQGVVLLHDIAVTDNGFGVYQFWDELKASGMPSFEFQHAGGLGMIAVGPQVPVSLAPFFNASPIFAVALRAFFEQTAARWTTLRQNEITQRHLDEEEQRTTWQQTELARYQDYVEELKRGLSFFQEQSDQREAQRASTESELMSAVAEVHRLQDQIHQMEGSLVGKVRRMMRKS